MESRTIETADRLIQVDDLTKIYDQDGDEPVTAIRDVDFSVEANEFVSIIGPSGCGKTTLLRILSGLNMPTSGRVLIGGDEIDGPIPDVGFVFQSPVLMDWRTVRQNILLPYEALESNNKAREDRPYYEDRVADLLDLVGLSDFESSYPDQLSGGMQQRVAICRALLPDPSILLMDEPFSALDEFTRETLNKELEKIFLETEKTLIYITHNIPEAVYLSDRVIVFSNRPGEIKAEVEVELGRPRPLKIRETDEFLRYVSRLREKITTE